MKSKSTLSSYQKIWSTVEKIPKGKVASYGQVARVSKMPQQARLVGYALHHLPHGIEIPWQRVVNSQGRISFPENSSAFIKQKRLLEKEGILFFRGKIDLKKYGWRKRSASRH